MGHRYLLQPSVLMAHHSLNKCVVKALHLLGMVLSAGEWLANMTHKIPAFLELTVYWT